MRFRDAGEEFSRASVVAVRRQNRMELWRARVPTDRPHAGIAEASAGDKQACRTSAIGIANMSCKRTFGRNTALRPSSKPRATWLIAFTARIGSRIKRCSNPPAPKRVLIGELY